MEDYWFKVLSLSIYYLRLSYEVTFCGSFRKIFMPRVPRARIGRKTDNATRMYNRRQQQQQQQRNALDLKAAFNYRSEIVYLNIPSLQIGPMTSLCPVSCEKMER